MVLSDQDLDLAEARILTILREEAGPIAPATLLERLAAFNISAALARAAIWYLIDRAAIVLTRKRLLMVAPEGAQELAAV